MAVAPRVGKKGKRKDGRAARKRYWDRRTLENRKVKNILANKQREHHKDCDKKNCDCPMITRKQAIRWWQSKRQGRVPDKFLSPLNKIQS